VDHVQRSVRYDQVNAMLLNEFLKEHREVQELQSMVAQQQKSFQSKLEAQEKQITVMTSSLRKIDAQFELRKPEQQLVFKNHRTRVCGNPWIFYRRAAMRTSDANVTTSRSATDYALGYTDAEQERLIRQATLIAPHTERLFREAGIGVGHRVLDLGSGMGDVSMLVAGLVGASGEVVGIERDPTSIERAQARVAAAGLRNVSFLNVDVNNIVTDRPFDAVVGRYILMFLPDPVSILRSVSCLVRPGGVLAFQEPSWIPMLALGDRLPLWSCVLRSIHETILRSGANPEMGFALYSIFQEVGLPAPKMHLEIPLGSDADFLRVICGLVCSLRPLSEQHNVSLKELGGLDTLPDRVCAEVAAANTVVSIVPLLGAWSRKPADSQGPAE
jgi:ubiquinone/menaquinone biosynthesis C-methylase UbiE